jgi:hypothetical protein
MFFFRYFVPQPLASALAIPSLLETKGIAGATTKPYIEVSFSGLPKERKNEVASKAISQ